MASNKGVDALKGTWNHIEDDNMDEFLKELGVSAAKRMIVKNIRPRLIISENGGKWTLQSETTLKTKSIEFIPDVEFDETTPDGRDVKTIVRFKNGAMEHITRDKNGKEWTATRYINHQGQQQIDIVLGSVKARRLFKRVD